MYVFYDIEASGLDKNFTQILQITLIFADKELNILSKKKMEGRLSPWVLPSPGAMLITGFSPADLKNNPLSNYEMMQEINQWIGALHWPVTFAGYNTLGYDEGLLADNRYQTLLPPYITTAQSPVNGESNGRFDLVRLVKSVYALMPGTLVAETKNDLGTPSFSLINIAEQNGISLPAAEAHDSEADTIATLNLARHLKKTAPALWDHLLSLSTEMGVDQFVSANPVFVNVDVYSRGGISAKVCTEVAEGLVYNLAVDPAPYLDLDEAALSKVLADRKGPFNKLKRADQPAIFRLDQCDAVLPKDFDEKTAHARAEAIASHPDFRKRLAAAAASAAPKEAKLLEQQRDLPMTAEAEKRLGQWARAFNAAADWKNAAGLLPRFYEDMGDEIKADPSLRRFAKIAGRLVYEHAPEALSDEQRDAVRTHIAQRLFNPDPKAPYMTLARAREELAIIEAERAEGKSKWAQTTDTQIRALKLYYTAIEKEYRPYLKQQQPPKNPPPPAAPQT